IFRKMLELVIIEDYDKVFFPFNTEERIYDTLLQANRSVDITTIETKSGIINKLENKLINVIETTFEELAVAPFYPIVFAIFPNNKQTTDYIEKVILCVRPGGSAVFLLKRELLDDESFRSFFSHMKIQIELINSQEGEYLIGLFKQKPM